MASKTSNEDEFEDTYVFVELSGLSDANFLNACDGEYKVLGLDTDKPVFEIGGQIFTGGYKDVYGTDVIFEEDEDKIKSGGGIEIIQAEQDPDHNVHVQPLRYKCHTNKKLHLFKGFLSEKGVEPGVGAEEGAESGDEEVEDDANMETDDDAGKDKPEGDADAMETTVDQT